MTEEQIKKYKTWFLDLLTKAPKVKRTHCYCQNTNLYEILCPCNHDHKTTWSEWEGHLWCFDCEKDYLITLNDSGIFSGPIPINISKMIGISFDRISVVDNSIVKFPELDGKEEHIHYNSTWCFTKEFNEYDKRINKFQEKIDEIEFQYKIDSRTFTDKLERAVNKSET